MADQITPPLPTPSPVQPPSTTAPTAIWSLVLAILSFFCGFIFTAIPAVICGHIARSRIRKSGYHQILAWSLKPRWEQNKELLREITRTFRGEK